MGHPGDLESGRLLAAETPASDRETLAVVNKPAAPVDDDGAQEPRQVSSHVKVASVVLYGTVSGSLTFFNKAVVSTFNWNFPLTILAVQMATAIVVLRFAKMMGWITFPWATRKGARAIAPMTTMYLVNVLFALSSLSRVNIPMYNVLKRLTPFIILVATAITSGKLAGWRVSAAVATMVAGAVVAGLGDMEFSSRGYLLALGSCFSQAAYLLYVQRTGKEKAKAGLSAHGLLYLQAVISLPVLVVASLALESSTIMAQDFSAQLAVTLGLSSLLGALLNFALFWCTMSNSALTTTIVGVVKSSATTIIGMLFMTSLPTALNASGIVLNSVGATVYTLIKAKVLKP